MLGFSQEILIGGGGGRVRGSSFFLYRAFWQRSLWLGDSLCWRRKEAGKCGCQGQARAGKLPFIPTSLPGLGGLPTSLTLPATLATICSPGGPLPGAGPWAEGREGWGQMWEPRGSVG